MSHSGRSPAASRVLASALDWPLTAPDCPWTLAAGSSPLSSLWRPRPDGSPAGAASGGALARAGGDRHPGPASARETLAAREVRRYFYVRTGPLLPIVGAARRPADRRRQARPAARPRARRREARSRVSKRSPRRNGCSCPLDRRRPRAARHRGRRAGRALRRLPPRRAARRPLRPARRHDPRRAAPASIPALDETARPLFPLRGIQPFHDFPEGPDWWSRDDYKADPRPAAEAAA